MFSKRAGDDWRNFRLWVPDQICHRSIAELQAVMEEPGGRHVFQHNQEYYVRDNPYECLTAQVFSASVAQRAEFNARAPGVGAHIPSRASEAVSLAAPQGWLYDWQTMGCPNKSCGPHDKVLQIVPTAAQQQLSFGRSASFGIRLFQYKAKHQFLSVCPAYPKNFT